ncbi:hypothetical protein EJB05_55299, partial [Eragrostis curvula]
MASSKSASTKFSRVSAAYPTCTGTQKREILWDCNSYIRKRPRPPLSSVKKDSSCCESVRQVPNRNMRCVTAMLTEEEKEKYSVRRILKLEKLCAPAPPPPRPVITYFIDNGQVVLTLLAALLALGVAYRKGKEITGFYKHRSQFGARRKPRPLWAQINMTSQSGIHNQPVAAYPPWVTLERHCTVEMNRGRGRRGRGRGGRGRGAGRGEEEPAHEAPQPNVDLAAMNRGRGRRGRGRGGRGRGAGRGEEEPAHEAPQPNVDLAAFIEKTECLSCDPVLPELQGMIVGGGRTNYPS